MNGSLKTIIFVAAIAFMAIIFWHTHQERKASINWPSTTGKILKAYVKQVTDRRKNNEGRDEYSSTHYEIAVEYEYVVDRTPYKGHRIRVVNDHYGSERSASNELLKYNVGADVIVYYDPEKPKNCVLIRG